MHAATVRNAPVSCSAAFFRPPMCCAPVGEHHHCVESRTSQGKYNPRRIAPGANPHIGLIQKHPAYAHGRAGEINRQQLARMCPRRPRRMGRQQHQKQHAASSKSPQQRREIAKQRFFTGQPLCLAVCLRPRACKNRAFIVIIEFTIPKANFSHASYVDSRSKEAHQDYPGIDYELLLGDYTEMEAWIPDGRVDCGFVRLPTAAALETIPLHALCEEPFMPLERGANTEISELFARQELHPHVPFTTWDEYTMLILRCIPCRLAARSVNPPAYWTLALAPRSLEHAPPPPLSGAFSPIFPAAIPAPARMQNHPGLRPERRCRPCQSANGI